MITNTVMMNIRTNDIADASGTLFWTRNWSWIELPIIVVFGLPRYSEFTKSPAAGMNVSSVPANTPGSESGSTTFVNADVDVE